MRHDAEAAEYLPSRWFNLLPYLPEPVPEPREPEDGHGSRIELVRRCRLAESTAQDRVSEPWVDIPGQVQEQYAEMGRPTPLVRARRLETWLETPARIYLKREDLLPTGSFKLNSSIAQAWYASQEGVPALVTETGAGQWGHAVAYASRRFGLESTVFWAAVSARQKPQREAMLRMLGATVFHSPSDQTHVGRTLRSQGMMGSLGTAIGEAIVFASDHPETRYISGSNHPHVLLHQPVLGPETQAQLRVLGEAPDVLVACVGGGSNLGGFMGPFLPERLRRGSALRFVAAESACAPRLTRGEWRYDHADPLGITPLSKSYTLGRDYVLPETHVGGLRQHNGSPIIGVLRHHGLIEPRAYTEAQVFDAGRMLARTEGIIAAPESCHALSAAFELASEARDSGRPITIVLCLSGSGVLDLEGYLAHPPQMER